MNNEQLTAAPRPVGSAPARVVRASQRQLAFSRRTRAGQRFSRVLDVGIAAILSAILAVPMLVIALLIRLTSRGPALYLQLRTGLNGKPFTMFKFRTMRLDAEAETGPIWATRDDPRRTAAGIVLRRFSLDELPQLFNVLRGDMSLVGPRPERPYFVEAFSRSIPMYDQRHQMLPGITGWAQINGWRGDSSIEKRLEFDLFYIRHWSVLLNLRILLWTPLKVLFDRN
jgi:exopolysaccharide biosynthesis polyprenyl glycosylphosphotransferase